MAGTCSGPGGTGPQYNFAELQGLWINAGGSKTVAPVAAAIALAESGGCSVDQNPNDNNGTQTSWGIWQISDGTHNQPDPNIYNPAVNAKAAVTKWQNAGQQFTDWGTYTSGAYRAHLSNGTPDLNVSSSAATNTGGAAASGCAVPDCAWGCVPGVTILGATVWQGECLVTYKQAREVLGAVILAGGVLVMGWGVQLLVGLAALPLATRVAAPIVSRVAGAQRAARQVRNITQ